MRLFVEQGFENTPTSQISEESNVSVGTLFYHYNSKEELINKIFVSVKESMSKSCFENFNEDLEFKDKLRLVWFNLIKWGFENRIENDFLSRFNGSVYINKLTVEEAKKSFQDWKKLFQLGIKNKAIKNISLTLFARITMSLYGACLSEFYGLRKLDNKLLDRSFQIYFDAIKNEQKYGGIKQ